MMTPKAGGPAEFVDDTLVADAIKSGLYRPLSPDARVTVSDDGLSQSVPLSDLHAAEAGGGFHPRTATEQRADEHGAKIERQHGGTLGAIGASLSSAVDTGLLGIPGALTKAIAPDIYQSLTEGQEAHPTASAVGGLAGAVGVTALTGGLGGAAEAGAEGAGLAARVGSGALRGAGEGGLLGAGSGVQELVRSDDPLSVERIASVIGSHALLGAAAGGVLGAAAPAVGELASGLAKSGKVIRGALKAGDGAADIPADLATKEAVEAGKKAVVDDLASYHAGVKGSNAWLAMDGENAAAFTGANKTVRKLLDEPIGLAESPGKALDAVRRQGKVLRDVVANGEEFTAKLAAEDTAMASGVGEKLAAVPEGAETVALEGKMAQRYSQGVLGKNRGLRAEALEVPVADAAKFGQMLEAGEMQGARAQALGNVGQLAEQNQAIEQRLVQIRDAEKALGAPAKQGFLADLAGKGALGLAMHLAPGGPIGAMVAMAAPKVIAKVGNLFFKRAAAAVAEQGAGTEAALDAFLGAGKAAAGRATLPLSTKVLNSVSYGRAAEPAMAKGTTELAAAYKKRAAELSSQVVSGMDGAPQMTPGARQQVADRLAPLHIASSQLADQLETHVAKKVEFLASKLPKRPGNGMQMGPDRWQPSNLEMRRFARFAAAAEDPAGIEQRLAHGVVSPEDAETYQTLYPERLAHLQMQIAQRLPELTKSLPYARKLSLSLLTGTALVPALQPEILRVLQGQYANEPGTEGGTEAPKAQPQFGSIKKESGTPSQQRSNPGQ